MELEFLAKIVIGIIGSLIGNLFFGSISLDETPEKAREQIKPLGIERRIVRDRLEIPSFVRSVPSDHFAGVSAPCRSLAEARRSAVNDVVRQVLGSIGVEYDHVYVDRVSGNVRGRGPERVLVDRLSGVAHGVALDIDRNIVRSSWCRDNSERYVFFVLVEYPDHKIREMRRLSKGARVLAFVVQKGDDHVRLGISEVNGVSVVISSADVKVIKRNRFSNFISFCVWHVPKGSQHIVSVVFDPIRVRGSSREISLSLGGCKKDVADYLLGAKIDRIVVLRGHDELGRDVSARVAF